MGLSCASPTAFLDGPPLNARPPTSPGVQSPKQRRAVVRDSTAQSHDLTQRPAQGSDLEAEEASRALLPTGSPQTDEGSLWAASGSQGAAAGSPGSLAEASFESSIAARSPLEVTHDGPQAPEIELAGMRRDSAGSGGDASQVSSRRSIQSGLPEDEELLSLRPTRDFVDNFNQHTSFHRRRHQRNAMEGDASFLVTVSPHRDVATLSALLEASSCRIPQIIAVE